ncbi:Phosphatidate cytidylyltransferase [Pseudobythopirellula maris]|uniref:Phosphatidate cytidylyltransferase n=1 Tax=Pseudobythopirellula maris TaxID=2527991 RepID=A0A5C5ZU73_9BACT|nr:phosphatidate cytidylyltransferase [Pseudobythopirellula maris]TWT89693.1 Phosphatidate cytidylyltransferase [Pseudobythopirellula maris]
MGEQNTVLAATVVGVLFIATLVGKVLSRQTQLGLNPAAIEAYNSRVRSWWIICCLLAVAFFSRGATVALFGFISFWALREFITLTPTRLSDHRALFWVFFFFTPLQYVLVGQNAHEWFSILIPVFAFLFIPMRIAIAGDPKRFLERASKIQAGLLVCVYCLSYAPALLYLNPRGAGLTRSDNARLLFFLVTLSLLSEAIQFAWSRLYGSHVIAPEINQSRTWEGFLGSAVTTALIGVTLYEIGATPFTVFWHAALVSMLIAVMGFAGAMTLSAVKRDRRVKDYGTLIEGHGGVLDRIDALCFAAPVFYYTTRALLQT